MKNETKMWSTIKNRILAVLAALLLGVGILTSFVVFTDFMEQTIYEESTAHLTEIYHQANQTLYNKVSFNWGVMRMWTPYLERAQSDADVCAFLAQAKEEYQFTDFFFVSRDGSYITLDGEQGYLDLGRTLSQLILEQQPIVANSVVPDKPEIMVFAVPTAKGSYQGFAYEAIAVTYNNKDLVDSLKISAFEGHGSTFAVLPDGRVVLDSSSADMRGVHNILAMLRNSAGFTAEQITTLQKAFAAGKTGNLEFSIHGIGYYMVYGSASFQNWTILGIVPKSVVNANMNRLQYTTMAVMSSIVGMLAVTALLLVVQSNRQKLRKKDQQLLAREELFSSLSRNVDDVFLMIDTGTGKVEYISPNVRRILGISPEAVQEDFHVLCSAEGDNCTSRLDGLMQMEQGTQQEWDREFIHQETGEPHYIHVTGFINEVQGAKKCIVDLSDRTGEHQTTLAVEAALEIAEKASQAKTDFLSNMSHDIRTPMNAIVGLTTLMENELDQPEKLAEHLHKLESSGQLLLGIINNILDMSRIESGKTTLSVEPMHLSQQLDQLSTMIRAQASEKAQTFTVSTHLRHENLLADPTRLNQVLMNILSNAVKYTPRGGHIRFEVEELPRNEHYAKYRFVVQDDGIGMSKAYQKTLFDPFTREERSGTNRVQGTGLGMAITKNIVDLMGGSISVESATGKGTRFEVVLEFPIDTEADAVPEAQALPEEPEDVSPLCGMNFLCAEDNAINAEILELLLKSKGAHCKICPNGQEIVDAFVRVKPGEYDMILMDVQMPVMDGLEAARRIRSSANPLGQVIPILAMTANAFLEDMQKSKEAGMDEHLSKPVDIDALEQTVKRFRVTPPR
ncbi:MULTISPECIES: hybrid sensor histidine kinase/response regulator [Faecalibacterium]|uniref:hybrid sensor histidine kinase/response regulator n=1 Tax=Faecalibacterium TaxID=216851 RepID=UPI001FA97223|nr:MULTISPECIES: ATP-binding protein [Faecalibacterium]